VFLRGSCPVDPGRVSVDEPPPLRPSSREITLSRRRCTPLRGGRAGARAAGRTRSGQGTSGRTDASTIAFWEDGRLRWHGRVDMTRSGLEGFGRSLTKDDEVVLEATGNAMAVVRLLSPYVARVVMAISSSRSSSVG
jgi:hypothetical protein